MPQTVRFHLDEHIPNAIAAGLRRRGIDVTTTKDASLIAAADPDQLAYATAQGRVLFTHDSDFLRLDRRIKGHSGIAYCRHGARTIGEIISGLELIWLIYEAHEMIGRVEYL